MTRPVRWCSVGSPGPQINSCHLDLPIRVVRVGFVVSVIHLDYKLRCLRPVQLDILRWRYVVDADIILFYSVGMFGGFALTVRVGRVEEIFPGSYVRAVVIVREIHLGPVQAVRAVVFAQKCVVFPGT